MESVYIRQFSTADSLFDFLNLIQKTSNLKSQEAYASTKWLERQMYFYEKSLSGISPRHSNLPLICSLVSTEEVVDIGGGSGWVKNIIPREIRYFNLELAASTRFFGKNLKNEISYINDIEEIGNSNPSILYSNSTLQYFLDQSLFDQMVARINAKWILLDDLYFSTSTSFYTLQRYYDLYIPTLFIDKCELIERMAKKGYQVILEMDYPAHYSDEVIMRIELEPENFVNVDKPKTMLFKKLNIQEGLNLG